jgi:cytoskeletal protein RodZ
MASIGETLRQARERRGISLSDVQNATKITPQNLAALEEEKFGAFPNRVYTRAFLRDYANFLGLDSGPLLEQYELQWNPTSNANAVEQPSKPTDGATTMVRSFAILVILVVVGLALYQPVARMIQRRNEPQAPPAVSVKPATPPVVAAVPTTAPTATPVAPPANSATPSSPVTSAPVAISPAPPVSTPPAAQQGVNLVIDALSGSWVKVVVDGKPAFVGILATSQQKSWHGNKVVLVRTGNAGGIRLTVNGKKLAPIGETGHIAERKFVAPL